MTFEHLAVGTAFPPWTTEPITRTDVVRYQGASGDFNPVHHDEPFALASGYPAPLGTPGPGGYPSPYGTPTGYPAQPYGTPGAAGHVPPPGQPYGAGYPPAGPYGAYPYGDPGRTESMATAAMIVGIAAFVAPVIAPIVAIVLGAVALNKIKRTGMRGRGQARAGIILGSAWLVLPIMAARWRMKCASSWRRRPPVKRPCARRK